MSELLVIVDKTSFGDVDWSSSALKAAIKSCVVIIPSTSKLSGFFTRILLILCLYISIKTSLMVSPEEIVIRSFVATSFAFISHIGKVQICGFLDVECGDIRKENYNFEKIWETSPVFIDMRNINGYHGRCGYCEYRKVCGGCRARAYAVTGDYLAEEPFCIYEPEKRNI